MTMPNPPPAYVYKIILATTPPPSPFPLNLPLSALDARDHFIHLSTSSQILGTLRNFFADEESVFVLRILYVRVEKWVRWENAVGKEPDEKGGCWDVKGEIGYFPHIHGNAEDGGLKLGREEVESVGVWKRGEGKWGKEGWPWEEDVPTE